jgi:hypothetical protein
MGDRRIQYSDQGQLIMSEQTKGTLVILGFFLLGLLIAGL